MQSVKTTRVFIASGAGVTVRHAFFDRPDRLAAALIACPLVFSSSFLLCCS